MIARIITAWQALLCWLRIHDRQVAVSPDSLRWGLFVYQCSRCGTYFRRIPGNEWERLEA